MLRRTISTNSDNNQVQLGIQIQIQIKESTLSLLGDAELIENRLGIRQSAFILQLTAAFEQCGKPWPRLLATSD